MTQGRSGTPTLKDGQALDRLGDRVERWAKKYPKPADEEAFAAEYDKKFRPEAEQLAAECTPAAKPFGVKEWIIAVPLWLILAAIVFIGSILLMPPEGAWLWLYIVVAVLVFVLGMLYVYLDTTSVKRAEKRYAEKVDWLLNVSRRTGMNVLRDRVAQTKG